jgi:peroxiredoxin
MQSWTNRGDEPLKSRARSKRSFVLFAFAFLFVPPVSNAQQPAAFKVQAPELVERSAAEWFNSQPLKLADLRGQVVVLHFWTFGCINCKHNDATYRAWQAKYSKQGVTMIAVHTPELAREHDLKRLKKSISDRGLKYPIVVDQDGKIWKSWDNHWWPSIYLIDKQGFARYRWDGELGWKGAKGQAMMEKKIEQLLAEEASAPTTAKR